MYLLLLSISILLFAVGLIMIFSPKAANWLNKSGNIVVLTEKKILEHRFYSGSISLLFGVFFMYKASGYQAVHTQILVVPFYSIGILLTMFGLLFFMSSSFFEKINSLTSREMINEKFLMKYRRATGAFMIVSALLLFFTAGFFK